METLDVGMYIRTYEGISKIVNIINKYSCWNYNTY